MGLWNSSSKTTTRDILTAVSSLQMTAYACCSVFTQKYRRLALFCTKILSLPLAVPSRLNYHIVLQKHRTDHHASPQVQLQLSPHGLQMEPTHQIPRFHQLYVHLYRPARRRAAPHSIHSRIRSFFITFHPHLRPSRPQRHWDSLQRSRRCVSRRTTDGSSAWKRNDPLPQWLLLEGSLGEWEALRTRRVSLREGCVAGRRVAKQQASAVDESVLEELDLLELEAIVRFGEGLVPLCVRSRKEFTCGSIRLLKNSGG